MEDRVTSRLQASPRWNTAYTYYCRNVLGNVGTRRLH
jgi:hypothetical protein